MIQNPELAQSYILVSILRQQCSKIHRKIQDIPKLARYIQQLQRQLQNKTNSSLHERQYRENLISQLTQQYQKRINGNKIARTNAQNKIKQLRSNINMIKQVKKEIMNQRKQYQDIVKQEYIQNQNIQLINAKIMMEEKIFQEALTKRIILEQELLIGKNRIKHLFNQNNQARISINNTQINVLSLKNQIKNATYSIKSSKQKLQSLQNKIFQMKLSICQEQQQKQDKKIKINQISGNISAYNMNINNIRQEGEKMAKNIQQLQKGLQDKIKQCQKVNGEVIILRSQCGSMQRDNKLNQHKIQCVRLLIRRLYSCRDRLIVLKRNNNGGKSIKSKTSGINSLGKLSRNSDFSVNFGSVKEQFVKVIQDQ